MRIRCLAESVLPAPPAAAFALMVDAGRFPDLFRGFGPIPAIRSVTLDGPLAVGATRRIHNADGSVLDERITGLDPPSRHAYTLTGFRPPFSWLVRRGDADWTVRAEGEGCRVRWDYAFVLTSAVVYPLAAPLLRVFMAGAMRRCLKRMAEVLA